MHIAMYSDTFYPSINGVAVSIATLATSLAQNGHDVFIQVPKPREMPDLSHFPKNITFNFVRAIDARIYPDLRFGTGLPLSLRKIQEFKPDIIHVHTPFSLGIEGVLIAKRLGIPTVYTFHTYFMDPDAMSIIGIKNRQLALLVQQGGWRFNNVFCSMFDTIIAPSQFVAKDLKKHKMPRPVAVCPNILGNDVYAKPRSHRARVQTLLYVGRLSPEKRVHLLLHALARLKKELPELQLTIIGDGPSRKDLFDLSFELGINSSIKWYGQIPHHDLIEGRHYHSGDLFVFLSRFETQGLVTLEAMAHGLPVVATASKANREVIGNGGIVLSDTANEEKTIQEAVKAIRQCCKEDLQGLRDRAYQQAERFRMNVLLPQFVETYQDIIARKERS